MIKLDRGISAVKYGNNTIDNVLESNVHSQSPLWLVFTAYSEGILSQSPLWLGFTVQYAFVVTRLRGFLTSIRKVSR